MNREVEWTPNIVDRLKELYANENNLSYKFIAERLTKEFGFKFTRSGVSGKIYRLNLPLRSESSPPVDTVIRPVLASPPVRREVDSTAPASAGSRDRLSASRLPKKNSHGIDLLDLCNGDCKWPTGDRAPYAFCGKPAVDYGTAVYCARHTEEAYVKPSKSWS